MGGDLPDYSRQITVLLNADIMAQMRNLPWWVRYAPSRTLYLDDFEGVLKWYQGAGTVARDNSINVFEGNYCLSLVTAAAADAQANAQLFIGAVPRSKFAIQLRWHPYESADNILRRFDVNMILYDGSYVSDIVLRYLKNETTPQNKWQYLNSAGAFVDLPNGAEEIDTTYRAHQSFYLTFDMLASVLKYGRLVTSKLALDLSSLGIRYSVDPTTPYIVLNLTAVTDIASAAHVYVDALCLSDEEP